jgi:hypothetical protein
MRKDALIEIRTSCEVVKRHGASNLAGHSPVDAFKRLSRLAPTHGMEMMREALAFDMKQLVVDDPGALELEHRE